MKKNKIQKDILYISISFFVLVVLWVGFHLYHAYATSTVTPELQSAIDPIDPTFNTGTIQELKRREKVIPVYELEGTPATDTARPSPESEILPTTPSVSTSSGALNVVEQ